jgi:hypothetical protein
MAKKIAAVRWAEWVVLIAGSTGPALREAGFWSWWYLSARRHSDILRDRSAAWSRS